MSLIKLTGGRVIDPANGVNDQVRDIYVRDGRIVAGPNEQEKVTAEYNIAGRIASVEVDGLTTASDHQPVLLILSE